LSCCICFYLVYDLSLIPWFCSHLSWCQTAKEMQWYHCKAIITLPTNPRSHDIQISKTISTISIASTNYPSKNVQIRNSMHWGS
jgi:hypothetical protein